MHHSAWFLDEFSLCVGGFYDPRRDPPLSAGVLTYQRPIGDSIRTGSTLDYLQKGHIHPSWNNSLCKMSDGKFLAKRHWSTNHWLNVTVVFSERSSASVLNQNDCLCLHTVASSNQRFSTTILVYCKLARLVFPYEIYLRTVNTIT